MAAILIALLSAGTALLLIRGRRRSASGVTWDCGYAAPSPRMQYSSSSFAETLVKLFGWALQPNVHRPRIDALFPPDANFESHVDDTVLEKAVWPTTLRRNMAVFLGTLSAERQSASVFDVYPGRDRIPVVVEMIVFQEPVHPHGHSHRCGGGVPAVAVGRDQSCQSDIRRAARPTAAAGVLRSTKAARQGKRLQRNDDLGVSLWPHRWTGDALVAVLVVPLGHASAPLSFTGDVILLAYVLGLGRFFTMAAALDTGSAFEGMGSAREATYACLAEPVMFLGLLVLARVTGTLS